MNNTERTIMVLVKQVLKSAGVKEEDISKKWLKMTATLLYFTQDHYYDEGFKSAWKLALKLHPAPLPVEKLEDNEMTWDLSETIHSCI